MVAKRRGTPERSSNPSPDGLSPIELYRRCDPNSLGFRTTDELPDLEDVIGQPRALRSLELGSEVSGPGYNVYVLGVSGSGRTTLTREYLQRKALKEPVPNDWCYVNHFANIHRPIAISLPAGRGSELRKDVQGLISRCEHDIPRIFESEEYTRERDRLVNELKKAQENEFLRLQELVGKYNFVIARTPFGFLLVPAVQGKPLSPEEVEKLSEEQRTKLSELQSKLGEEVEKSLNKLRDLEKTTYEKLQDLNNRTVLFLIGPLVKNLKEKYAGLEAVLVHLDAVLADIITNASQFHTKETSIQGAGGGSPDRGFLRRYEVNVLVDNSNLQGAPVILENNPSYTNLIGRIEHEAFMGASRTDFTMIRPGALHRANDGYLMIPVRDVLMNPYAWEGLKRVLRDGEIRVVELANQLGFLSTATLDPQPIPLSVKIVMVGTPLLYYLLRAYDEDFSKLFKVRAEFTTLMDRTPDTEREYGLFVKSVVDDNSLIRFNYTAVARLVEYSSRLAGDQYKLTTQFGKISDLIRESSYWAKKEKRKTVTAKHVQRAIEESIYRSNLIENRIQELIAKGVLLIDVAGEAVGQINAISVIGLGDYTFGRPNRVTAAAYPGKSGVVDIERQAKLGGPIHTKGVLILNGFLGNHYGRGRSLSLAASLTFEQTYEEVEGDSASAAELIALLSAITEIPIRQDRAITGSVNQHGRLQTIGGVNEKIEGFYTTCKAMGFNGEQGVIIPASNTRHLMLRDEVVKAVEKGRFHIWPVGNIDEALELLTSTLPGKRQPDGNFPEGSFNRAVIDRLDSFSQSLKASAKENANTSETEEKKSATGGNS